MEENVNVNLNPNDTSAQDALWDYVDRAARLEFIINATILRQLIEEAYGILD